MYIWVFFFCLYFLTNSGEFRISDGEVMFQTTVALASGRGIALEPNPGLPQIVAGRDGRYYSKYSIGTPLAAVPFYGAGRVLAKLLPNADAMGLGHFMVAQLNVVASATSVAVFFLLVVLLFRSESMGLVLSALYGLSTAVWPYAGVFFSEPLFTLCLLVAFYGAVRYRRDHGPGWLLMAGAALGYSVLVKVSGVVLLPLFLGYLLFAWRAQGLQRFWDAVFLGVPLAAAGAVVLWHNYARFGSPWDNGYSGEAFTTPVWVGLYGLLFSSGKSVFLYSPPLVLSAWGVGRFVRKVGAEALLAVSVVGVTLLYYAGWWAWYGGWCWGPRFMVPAIPFALLALGAMPWSRLGLQAGAAALAILGAGVQLLGVLVDFNDYIASVVQDDPQREWLYIFYPWMSPVLAHFNRLIAEGPTLLRVGRYYQVGLPEPLSTVATVVSLAGLIAAAVMVARRYTLLNIQREA